MKRREALLLSTVGAVLGLTPAVQAAQKITITVASVEPFQSIPYVAVEKGYFADEGLDVELLPAGGGVATPALISGTVAASGSSASALSAILRGAPLRIVFALSDNPPYRVWAGPDIHTLADLKGKLVGVATRGDTYEIATRIALRNAGIPPDSVGFSPLGSVTNMGAALDNGALAAIVLATGDSAAIQDRGLLKNAHVIADFHGKVLMPYAGIAVSEKLYYGDPVLAKNMLRAMVKAGRYIKAFKAETVAILGKYQKPVADPQATAAEYDDLMRAITRDFTISNAEAAPDLDVRASLINLPKDKIPPIDKIYDFSVVHAVNSELDAKHWKPTR